MFENLINFVTQRGVTFENDQNAKRWVKTTDDEKDWLTSCNIVSEYVTPTLRTCKIIHANRHYFGIIGDVPCTVSGDEFTEVEVNAGIFTAVCFELNLSPPYTVSAYDIVNEVIALSTNIDGYEGHDLESVIKYFPPFILFEIAADSTALNWPLARLSGYFFAEFADYFTLTFTNEFRTLVSQTFLECNLATPFDNLLSALFEVHWQNSFMDIYRCVESTFFIPFMKELSSKISVTMEPHILYKAIEDCTGWRAKEDEAMRRLFDDEPSVNLSQTCSRVKSKLTGVEEGRKGDWLYKIRNSIVHHRPAANMNNWNDEQWNDLLICLVVATKDSFLDAPTPAPSPAPTS